jgi:DNA-binding GntR family transcriptional regulator
MEADVPAEWAANGILADRIAAVLVHREPGWQLPRRSALARRYNVSLAEIDTALGELTRRSMIRRLPDGQFYRASPAEYLIPLEGIGGLSTRLDPMGGEIIRTARTMTLRAAAQDVAGALGIPVQAPVRIIRSTWSADAEPVAISTAYVPGAAAGPVPAESGTFDDVLHAPPEGRLADGAVYAGAAVVELTSPQPGVARGLRLPPGQPAVTVTIRFDSRATMLPVGLTAVTMKPQYFRVVLQAGDTLPLGIHPAEPSAPAVPTPRPNDRLTAPGREKYISGDLESRRPGW